MTRRRPSRIATTYRTPDTDSRVIDPVKQLNRYDIRIAPAHPPAVLRRAALAVCSNATSVADARMLLSILGLDQETP